MFELRPKSRMRGGQQCAEQVKWHSRQKERSALQPEGEKELDMLKGTKEGL